MIAILDYGAGNLTSVRLAFERIGGQAEVVTSASRAEKADKIIFPGVGSAASGMAGFCGRGFDRVLRQAVADGKPVLVICLGMQMLFEKSAEDGGVEGLGILPGTVEVFSFPPGQRVKIPHMGWNGVDFTPGHPMLNGINPGEAFYFVHSYYVRPGKPDTTLGRTEYAGFNFTAAAGRGNLFATQFHPERSGTAGLRLLKNFLEWDGTLCS
jgi:glutamine amidotransferase